MRQGLTPEVASFFELENLDRIDADEADHMVSLVEA